MKPAADRLWSKVDRSGGTDACWPFTGALNRNTSRGYGVIRLGPPEFRLVRAHRAAYEISRGPIPNGMSVLHRCDNPPCVNPAHLWLGTQADNIADMIAKGRQRHITTAPAATEGSAPSSSASVAAGDAVLVSPGLRQAR